MATRTAKLRLELDGEKQYKAAIAEINRENRTLGAEMKKLAAEYKGSETSIEALTKKQSLLDRALLESKAKVEETKKQLDSWKQALERVRQEQGASSEEYKTAQRKVQEYEYALANAETQQIELENAIRENNDALEDSTNALEENNDALDDESGKMVSLGDVVDGVAQKLGINLPDGAKKALDGIGTMSQASVVAIAAITAAVKITIDTIKKLNDMTLEAAGKVDDLITKSMQTGVSTQALQQWEYASSFIDVSVDTITGALTKVTKAAANDSDAFEKLGVRVRDAGGNLRDNEDIFFDSLRALSEIGNETERDAIAQELFGKSAQELNPLILQLDEAQRLYNEALDEGYVMTDRQVEILGEVDDAHEKYTQTVEKNKNLISVQWAPAVKDGYELLTKLIDKAGQMLIDSKLVENFAGLVTSTLALIDTCSELFDLMPSWMNPINILSNALKGLATIMATIADTANLISGLMPWNWGSGKATTALGWNINKGQMSNLQQLKYGGSDYAGWTWNEELGAWNASGNDNWRGGLTWVGEAGPELVSLPRGSQIYSAQESRSMGGSQVININVQGIAQLDEIVSWYESRRVRGRMA